MDFDISNPNPHVMCVSIHYPCYFYIGNLAPCKLKHTILSLCNEQAKRYQAVGTNF